MSKKAMKLALEALKVERDNYLDYSTEDGAPEYIYEAIRSLEFEVAKQEQGEPVGQVSNYDTKTGFLYKDLEHGTLLYTTSQQPVIDKSSAIRIATALGWTPPKQDHGERCIWRQTDDINMPDTWEADCGAMWTFTEGGPKDNDMNFCPNCGKSVIEAKLKEKNT